MTSNKKPPPITIGPGASQAPARAEDLGSRAAGALPPPSASPASACAPAVATAASASASASAVAGRGRAGAGSGSPRGLEAPEALLGETINGLYTIDAHIGTGAMGHVYRARQRPLNNAIALKVLHSHLRGQEAFEERFEREVQASSRLDHPNCIQLLDYGADPQTGRLYLAMELIEGRSLTALMRDEGPLPLLRVVRLATQITAALDEAHARGIIHRDLKPDNVLIEDRHNEPDFVKVLDFGAAYILDDGAQASGVTRVVGTAEYMSPEQARGAPLDGRSDVYSVGVLLYEMVTGERPFEGDTRLALVTQHLNEAPRPPRERRPELEIDPALEGIILSCLLKQPHERPGSASRLHHLLAQLAPDDALSAAGHVRMGSVSEDFDAVLERASLSAGVAPSLASAAAPRPPGAGTPTEAYIRALPPSKRRGLPMVPLALGLVAVVCVALLVLLNLDPEPGDAPATPGAQAAAAPAASPAAGPAATGGSGLEGAAPDAGGAHDEVTLVTGGLTPDAALNPDDGAAADAGEQATLDDDASAGAVDRDSGARPRDNGAAGDGAGDAVAEGDAVGEGDAVAEREAQEARARAERRRAAREREREREQQRVDSVTQALIERAEQMLSDGNVTGAKTTIQTALRRAPDNERARELARQIERQR